MDQAELVAKTVSPATPKHSYVSIRSFPTDGELKLAQQKMNTGWVHIRPSSVLVCAMGYHWPQGSWNRVVDMMQYTQQAGSYVGLQEIQDRCLNPYDALGTMRNEAILTAESEGFEFLLYVDNDIQPKPDTLSRLLAWDMPIVAPLVLEPGTSKQLSGPAMQPNSGLHPGKWSVLSMLLFRTAVLRPFRGRFWSDAIGADEGFHFMTLWAEVGHRVYIDTNTQLIVGKEPLYPLASNRFSPEERTKFWNDKLQGLLGPPDRRAINPFGPGVVDGDYMPFAAQPQGQPAATPQKLLTAGWGQRNGHEDEKKEVSAHAWGS